jgi:hypothetical protein
MAAAQQRDQHEQDLVPFADDDPLDIVTDQARYGLDSTRIHALLSLLQDRRSARACATMTRAIPS